MDKTGLVGKINTSVMAIYQGRKWLDTEGLEGEGRISYKNGLVFAIEAFRDIQSNATNDLELLVGSEYAFLGQELEFCSPQDTKAGTSLSKAIQDFDEAFLALEVLQNTEGYKFVEKAVSHHAVFRYGTMPKDAFHVACAGHKARLDNILKSPGINLLEKELLKQRQANMITAQSVYLEMQKKILANK